MLFLCLSPVFSDYFTATFTSQEVTTSFPTKNTQTANAHTEMETKHFGQWSSSQFHQYSKYLSAPVSLM